MHNCGFLKAFTLSMALVVLAAGSALGGCGAGSGGNLQSYDALTKYFEVMTSDLLKLMPRAMGAFIYQNRQDYIRGMTFMARNIESNPLKQKDFEEVRREAYARLMRDIPYCVEALKGGELKLDTPAGNLAGRLGMIAYLTTVLKMPMFPDLVYQEKFCSSLVNAIVESQIDVWVFYDGYGDFHSLGELMERLAAEGMPSFKHVRNDQYASKVKQDEFYMFRAPERFERNMVVSNVDVNEVYSNIINTVLDAYVYIWKCSGMDLTHPSYAAPPGTVISRVSRRVASGSSDKTRPIPSPVATPEAAGESATEQIPPLEPGAELPSAPAPSSSNR
jgi:hypothetical protein